MIPNGTEPNTAREGDKNAVPLLLTRWRVCVYVCTAWAKERYGGSSPAIYREYVLLRRRYLRNCGVLANSSHVPLSN
jgi:hypothetical protein